MVKTALISTALAAAALGSAQTTDFHLINKGAMAKIGFYAPQQLKLDSAAPAADKGLPSVGGDSLYGSIKFGGKLLPVVVSIDKGEPKAFIVDTTGTGDFSNAKSFEFAVRGAAPNQFYMGSADLPSPAGHGKLLSIMFYRFAMGTQRGDMYKTTMFYYSDYAMDGSVNIDGTKYHAMIDDFSCSGEFVIPKGPVNPKAAPSVLLLIDRNGDGRFSGPSEEFNAATAFNIGGNSLELKIGKPDGSLTSLVKSSQAVAEVMPPPNTAVGQKVLAFTTTDRNGKTVNFPADFKGKVVMLDFWATWCGPCMGEVPNVVKQYNTYHDKGFEILGISLDNKDTINNITKVTGEKGMTWDQVADGKYWDAAIAKLYGIQAIPAAFIVDGDTGMIVAEGEAIRGEALAPAIEKALAQKKGAPK